MAGVFNLIPNTSNAIVTTNAVTTSVKTMAQVATPSTTSILVLGWSISFDGSAAGKGIYCELVWVDVAATVTSFTPTQWDSPNDEASLCVGGAALTGYNASAEGTIAAYNLLDAEAVPPTSGYTFWFPEGRLPRVPKSKFLRLRTTGSSGVTPNAILNIIWKE